MSDQVEREERMEGLLPRRRRFKWLKFLMQLSGRCVMRKVREKPIGGCAKKTEIPELKSWAVKQFRTPTRFRVQEMSTCWVPLTWRHLNTRQTLHVTELPDEMTPLEERANKRGGRNIKEPQHGFYLNTPTNVQ